MSFVGKARIVKKGATTVATDPNAPRPKALGTAAGADAVAALYLALQARQEQALEANLDRTTELAVALAERIVGSALEVDPAKIGKMATALLAEARGAKRSLFEANPLDVDALRAETAFLGESVAIEPNSELARGSLVLHTDLGTVDGRLTPQLERLAAALRDALR
ncbi:MAG: FliH/SctL family protein [Polyangiaceae bacterium]